MELCAGAANTLNVPEPFRRRKECVRSQLIIPEAIGILKR